MTPEMQENIKESKKIHVIANTSFNISSDPMVYSKEDAYLSCERMGIKYILYGYIMLLLNEVVVSILSTPDEILRLHKCATF